jgi:hypothetical protein
LLAQDVQEFHELLEAISAGACGRGALTDPFVRMHKSSGTIANGRCYVAVSRVAGLGLFASQTFAAGDVVTAYGGGLRCARFVRSQGTDALTHARRIPRSDFVRDGRPWAALFDCSALDVAAERKRAAADRTRVLPVDIRNDFKDVAMGTAKASSCFALLSARGVFSC